MQTQTPEEFESEILKCISIMWPGHVPFPAFKARLSAQLAYLAGHPDVEDHIRIFHGGKNYSPLEVPITIAPTGSWQGPPYHVRVPREAFDLADLKMMVPNLEKTRCIALFYSNRPLPPAEYCISLGEK